MAAVSGLILFVHVLSGFLSLLSGLIAVLSVKGSGKHRLAGKVFFLSMFGVCSSAVIIALAKDNRFLLLIGIFAFYQTFAGWRAVKNKSLVPGGADRIVLTAGTINSFFMVLSLQPVLVVFGLISSMAVVRHWSVLRQVSSGRLKNPAAWLQMHIGMMMGSFIATVTAFLVVNYKVFSFLHLPGWFFWLLPSAVLSPLIMYWTKKYTSTRPQKTLS